MNTATKTRILDALGDATLGLTVAAGLPYAFGDVANILPPKAKAIVTVSSLVIAGALKFVQHVIQIVTAVNTPDAPAIPPGPQSPFTPPIPPSNLNPSKL